MIIKFDKTQPIGEFLKQHGSMAGVSDFVYYYYLPIWFEVHGKDSDGVDQIHHLTNNPNSLPSMLREHIQEVSGNSTHKEILDIKNYIKSEIQDIEKQKLDKQYQ